MSVQEYRDKMIAELRKLRSAQAELVEEYVQEAEGQDGLEYWYEFSTIGEMLEDFDLFVEAVSGE